MGMSLEKTEMRWNENFTVVTNSEKKSKLKKCISDTTFNAKQKNSLSNDNQNKTKNKLKRHKTETHPQTSFEDYYEDNDNNLITPQLQNQISAAAEKISKQRVKLPPVTQEELDCIIDYTMEGANKQFRCSKCDSKLNPSNSKFGLWFPCFSQSCDHYFNLRQMREKLVLFLNDGRLPPVLKFEVRKVGEFELMGTCHISQGMIDDWIWGLYEFDCFSNDGLKILNDNDNNNDNSSSNSKQRPPSKPTFRKESHQTYWGEQNDGALKTTYIFPLQDYEVVSQYFYKKRKEVAEEYDIQTRIIPICDSTLKAFLSLKMKQSNEIEPDSKIDKNDTGNFVFKSVV